MPVFALDKSYGFPDPRQANPDGLLAVGGDLHPRRLVNAYAMGIFPWFDSDSPILWWSPDPRLILKPDQFKLTRSLKQSVRTARFSFTADTVFDQVIQACAQVVRQEETGTWITDSMLNAYHEMHELALAHSIEVWQENKLVGGLYGISLGRAFFGESMFYKTRDASKAALWKLCRFLEQAGFHFIDAQMRTDHLIRLGATEVPRVVFLDMLEEALRYPSIQEDWGQAFEAFILGKPPANL